MTEDHQHVVVRKPWGYEYLMYRNIDVAVWYLHLNPGGRTSLHCHPQKKTGLILVAGQARISFLNDGIDVKPIYKTMIRPGLFHQTIATGPEGASVIEVETPRDKTNLVRLEDEYGREAKPYEGPDAYLPLTNQHVQLCHPQAGESYHYQVDGCELTIEKVADLAELSRMIVPEHIVVILEGGLISQHGEIVLAAGDVVSTQTLDRLVRAFSAPNGLAFFTLRITA